MRHEIICVAAFFLIFTNMTYGQAVTVNCKAFLYQGDTIRYKACNKVKEIEGYYQFSKEFQEILDESISIDPTFDYPYREKSIAYLKSGDFVTWKKLIDKAVELNPVQHLGARAWCRYAWFRDYQGAINDIERLTKVTENDIGYSTDGAYHLEIVRGICYAAIGDTEKALTIIKSQLSKENYQPGLYDYYQLGVFLYSAGECKDALNAFMKQDEVNTIAENKYYLALLYKELG